MANKFGLSSLPLETKKHNTTAWINKAKPYFLDQIGDTLQDYIDDTKLQQEVTSLKNFIQQQLVNVVDETQLQTLSSLISNLDDKITKQKIDLKQLIANINPGISEDKLQRELTEFKTELQKELTNIQQNIDIVIQQQSIDDSEIKTYIHQQIQNIDDSVIQQQITTINNLVLKQDKNIVALEKKFLKKESYYFTLPFRSLSYEDASITDNIDGI
ncbi:hypothetical protein LOTGIDRAFT_173478 [Lottia gigantea]|uniref:Uncharacterized protein n=1 Tax=Lottia gigantea TaxID=225164 RepID=V4B0X1_LOTGI|nr:hypothetical protein LOTGIDRAFT_173478 [Lottia gigantea]ESO99876.1 hypothetical protein LOTGIDRAFT_173478 [Lottia gigantea]